MKKAFSPKVQELRQLRYHVKTTHERCGPFSLVVLSRRQGRVTTIGGPTELALPQYHHKRELHLKNLLGGPHLEDLVLEAFQTPKMRVAKVSRPGPTPSWEGTLKGGLKEDLKVTLRSPLSLPPPPTKV